MFQTEAYQRHAFGSFGFESLNMVSSLVLRISDFCLSAACVEVTTKESKPQKAKGSHPFFAET
jgi:hypothetical protein